LYKLRHKKDMNVKNSNGYYADKLLWWEGSLVPYF
jgi:hypothetical protein